MAEVARLWGDLEGWLREHSPQLLETLGSGASSEQLAYYEEGFGVPFPDSVREFFACRAGQGQEAVCGLLDGSFLLDFEQILEEWQRMGDSLNQIAVDRLEVRGPVQRLGGHRGWIPFASDYGGQLFCFDLVPAPGGHCGQVIEVDFCEDRRFHRWDSPAACLEWLIGGLRSGDVVLDDAIPEKVVFRLPLSLRDPGLEAWGLALERVGPGEDAQGPPHLALALALHGMAEAQVQLPDLAEIFLEDGAGQVRSHGVGSLHRVQSGRLLPILIVESDQPPASDWVLTLPLIRRCK